MLSSQIASFALCGCVLVLGLANSVQAGHEDGHHQVDFAPEAGYGEGHGEDHGYAHEAPVHGPEGGHSQQYRVQHGKHGGFEYNVSTAWGSAAGRTSRGHWSIIDQGLNGLMTDRLLQVEVDHPKVVSSSYGHEDHGHHHHTLVEDKGTQKQVFDYPTYHHGHYEDSHHGHYEDSHHGNHEDSHHEEGDYSHEHQHEEGHY